MQNLPHFVSFQMNEMRNSYVDANNRIIEKMDLMAEEFVNEIGVVPEISEGVKLYIEDCIRHMREIVVDHVGMAICEFKAAYNPCEESTKSRRFPKFITDELERSFEVDQYPSDHEKAKLSKICKLSIKQINNWFTNKRNRNKGHDDCREY